MTRNMKRIMHHTLTEELVFSLRYIRLLILLSVTQRNPELSLVLLSLHACSRFSVLSSFLLAFASSSFRHGNKGDIGDAWRYWRRGTCIREWQWCGTCIAFSEQ